LEKALYKYKLLLLLLLSVGNYVGGSSEGSGYGGGLARPPVPVPSVLPIAVKKGYHLFGVVNPQNK
jgi:hypothetical protein